MIGRGGWMWGEGSCRECGSSGSEPQKKLFDATKIEWGDRVERQSLCAEKLFWTVHPKTERFCPGGGRGRKSEEEAGCEEGENTSKNFFQGMEL